MSVELAHRIHRVSLRGNTAIGHANNKKKLKELSKPSKKGNFYEYAYIHRYEYAYLHRYGDFFRFGWFYCVG